MSQIFSVGFGRPPLLTAMRTKQSAAWVPVRFTGDDVFHKEESLPSNSLKKPEEEIRAQAILVKEAALSLKETLKSLYPTCFGDDLIPYPDIFATFQSKTAITLTFPTLSNWKPEEARAKVKLLLEQLPLEDLKQTDSEGHHYQYRFVWQNRPVLLSVFIRERAYTLEDRAKARARLFQEHEKRRDYEGSILGAQSLKGFFKPLHLSGPYPAIHPILLGQTDIYIFIPPGAYPKFRNFLEKQPIPGFIEKEKIEEGLYEYVYTFEHEGKSFTKCVQVMEDKPITLLSFSPAQARQADSWVSASLTE